MVDISDQDLEGPLRLGLEAMAEAAKNGKPILIHCQAGISRSGAIAIGWIMMTRRMTFDDALIHVRIGREKVDPNIGFCLQLESLEPTLIEGFGIDLSFVAEYDRVYRHFEPIVVPQLTAEDEVYRQRPQLPLIGVRPLRPHQTPSLEGVRLTLPQRRPKSSLPQ